MDIKNLLSLVMYVAVFENEQSCQIILRTQNMARIGYVSLHICIINAYSYVTIDVMNDNPSNTKQKSTNNIKRFFMADVKSPILRHAARSAHEQPIYICGWK